MLSSPYAKNIFFHVENLVEGGDPVRWCWTYEETILCIFYLIICMRMQYFLTWVADVDISCFVVLEQGLDMFSDLGNLNTFRDFRVVGCSLFPYLDFRVCWFIKTLLKLKLPVYLYNQFVFSRNFNDNIRLKMESMLQFLLFWEGY